MEVQWDYGGNDLNYERCLMVESFIGGETNWENEKCYIALLQVVLQCGIYRGRFGLTLQNLTFDFVKVRIVIKTDYNEN